jgi:ABC-2 type transport system ATP-binding protein
MAIPYAINVEEATGLEASSREEAPAPKGTVISVRGVTMRFPVTKRYRELMLHPFRPRRMVTALSSATLNVERGDRIAVLGPNGAGKTTMLKLIGGLLLPTEGDIVVNGFSTAGDNTAARRAVGFVMNEERSFFWRLSGIQNLEFFGALDDLQGSELRDRIRELISLVRLEAAADMPVADYSSGMKQRLALARGLIAEPDVLVLDEPTRALDPLACEHLVKLILSRIYQDSRRTLLIATHRLEEAMTLCNKVLIIDKGELRAFDSIASITASGRSLSDYYRQHVTAEAL